MVVQIASDRLVLKALVLHHVAPVAGRIADGKKDRLIFGRGALDRFGSPGIPIDRIVLVLQKVRARSAGQVVRHESSRVQKRSRQGTSGETGWLLRLGLVVG